MTMFRRVAWVVETFLLRGGLRGTLRVAWSSKSVIITGRKETKDDKSGLQNALPCVGEPKLPKLVCLPPALVGVGTEGAGVPIALVILPMLANTAPRPCVCTAG